MTGPRSPGREVHPKKCRKRVRSIVLARAREMTVYRFRLKFIASVVFFSALCAAGMSPVIPFLLTPRGKRVRTIQRA